MRQRSVVLGGVESVPGSSVAISDWFVRFLGLALSLSQGYSCDKVRGDSYDSNSFVGKKKKVVPMASVPA